MRPLLPYSIGADMPTQNTSRHAFTILELLVIIGIIALLIGILLPALGSNCRGRPMNVVAQANLRSLTTGAMNYAGDHNDSIFSYTWKVDESYRELSSGNEHLMTSNMEAAAFQAMNILQRSTGRLQGTASFKAPSPQLMHLRYSHLVLMDWLTDRQPEPIAASPFDKNLIDWQENPLAYLDEKNNFPYGKGLPTKPGYDMNPIWTDPAIAQLWPLASTYQVVPHAWLNDTNPQYTPSPTSPHHMIDTGSKNPMGGRKMSQVAHPSGKVFMYEEFDRFTNEKKPLYATDPIARINLAFFDGSVRQELVKDANSAYDKDNPSAIWEQPYLPLDTFPLPSGGLNDQTKLDLRFRWTKNGLAGIDYP